MTIWSAGQIFSIIKTASLRGFLILWYNSENMLKWDSDKSKKLRNFAVNTVVPLFFALLFGILMFWPKNRFLGHNFIFFAKTWITFAVEGLWPSFRAHSEGNYPFYEPRKKYFQNSSPTPLLRGDIEFSSFLKFSLLNIVPDCTCRSKKILRILVH